MQSLTRTRLGRKFLGKVKGHRRTTMRSQIRISSVFLSFTLALALLIGPSCKANVYTKVDFKTRAANAADILIGTVVSTSSGICAYQSRCAKVEVISVAKGSVSAKEVQV